MSHEGEGDVNTNSTHLLVATLQYYRNAANNETNPVIKAHYQKQGDLLDSTINARDKSGDPKGEAPRATIPESAIKVMCEAWSEMNAIRARDGVPYTHNGYKSGVAQEYWDDIMKRLDDEVTKATGRGCWLHPVLYSPTITTNKER